MFVSRTAGFVSIEASADLEKTCFLADDPIKIVVLRASLDGTPEAGNGTWRIAALKGPSAALLPAEQPLLVPKEIKAKKSLQQSLSR